MPKTATPPPTIQDDPAVTNDGEQFRLLDSYSYARHKGTDSSAAEAAEGMRIRLGLSHEQVAARLTNVLARKKLAAAEKAKREAPPDGKRRVVLAPHKPKDEFLRYAGADGGRGVGIIESHLSADRPIPLPPIADVGWCPHPDYENEFDYLISVIKRIYAGELVPGRVGYIRRREERFGPTSGLGDVIMSDEERMGFDLENWRFLRLPNQSQKQLDSAVAEFTKNLQRAQDRSGIQQTEQRRPVMAVAAAGGPRTW